MLTRVFILILIALNLGLRAQTSQGPLNPGSTGNTDYPGTSTAWNNTSRITTSNGSKASATGLSNGEVSDYLTATNFGFTIPAGATITGIKVDIERDDNSGSSGLKDNEVKIIKANSITGTDHASNSTWPNNAAYATYGSNSDLWGTTWTAADINSSQFGVALSVQRSSGSGNNDAFVDHIRITVYYTVSGLPIELLYFNGTQNNNISSLEWATATENNTDFFDIEYSTDAIEWTTVGVIKSAGFSSTTITYKYDHNNTYLGYSYYRLKQVDLDGKFEIFNVVSVYNGHVDKVPVAYYDMNGTRIYDHRTYPGIYIVLYDDNSIDKKFNINN